MRRGFGRRGYGRAFALLTGTNAAMACAAAATGAATTSASATPSVGATPSVHSSWLPCFEGAGARGGTGSRLSRG
jgi:hypothetical protein